VANHRRKDLDDAAYRKARAEFLQHNDVCQWCRRAKATTIDHITPVMHGIDPKDQSNWAPACHKCNSRRGAEALAQKRNQNAKNRKNPKTFFENEKKLTPSPSVCVPLDEGNPPGLAGNGAVPADRVEFGRIPPRLFCAAEGVGSFGAEVAALAARDLGIELMPWQIEALEGQLRYDAGGQLCHTRSLVSVSRQNGKSVALKALAYWILLSEPVRRREPITLITTAHNLDLASELFYSLAPILEARYQAKLHWSKGHQRAEMPDGTRWLVQAATPRAFHGFSPHYILADEIWDISGDVIFQGALPSQRARREPLFSAWSTAGTEDSIAMMKLREAGLRAIDEKKPGRLFFAEWSVPPGVSPEDPVYWPMANPALGYTLTLDRLEEEFQSPDKSAFLRAALNLWIASASSWIEPGEFARLRTTELPAGGIIAVDSSIDDSMYFAVRAVPIDGKVGVTVAFTAETLAGVWQELEAAAADCTRILLTPSLDAIAPPWLDRKKTTVGYAELLTHTQNVRQMIRDGILVHTGERMLEEHVNRAVGVRAQNQYALSSQKSPGPIALARCMVWAAGFAARPGQLRSKPAIAFGR
jgi:hypothetical protein